MKWGRGDRCYQKVNPDVRWNERELGRIMTLKREGLSGCVRFVSV